MYLKVMIRIAFTTILILVPCIFFQINQNDVFVGNASAAEMDDPYVIDSSDYLFPNNGLEKKDNVTELAETVLDIFDMGLTNSEPEVYEGKWRVTGSNYTKYTFVIGERRFFNSNENAYMTRLHQFKLIYFGELFYYLEINFDWNLGENMEVNAFHIINSMTLPDMSMRINYMDIDGGLRIRSEKMGFNDTNFMEIYETSAYYLDDGVWGKGREIRISAWLNVSWSDFPETEKFILNKTLSIYDFILENYNQSINKDIVWIYGAWDRELTWFELDPVNESLRLSLRDELRFWYLFRIPEDNYMWYGVLINFSTSNGSILGSEDGYIAENGVNGGVSNYKIIHYYRGYQTDKVRHDPDFLPIIPIFCIILFTLIVLFSFLSLLILAKISKKGIFDNINRKNIYDTIKENQGIHFRDLMKMVDIKQGVLGYHLNILEDENYIKSIQRGNKRCFFTRDDKGDLKLKLNMAQQRILHEINLNPGISLKDLARVTSKTPTLVYYHTSILMDAGLIEKEKDYGRSKFFVSTIGKNYVAGS
ncbi:MAG: winged helix-turn-helix transcriptional regulator [Candidatus Thermoplasmatota archaeon]|nr:winged helix-turn-helix transcriptional regulator [Candidatus Thermoplasmatota archaeon]